MSTTWQLPIGNSTFETLSEELLHYFASRLKGSADPEDFVAQIWLDSRRYEGRAPFRYYLFTIARIKVAEHWRQLSRLPEPFIPESDFSFEQLPALMSGAETVVERVHLVEVVRECLAKVEHPFHEVVSLWLLEDLDPIQIATETGIPYNTVRSRLARGKKQLATAIRRRTRR